MYITKQHNQTGTANMNKPNTSALNTKALKARWMREAAKGKEAAKMTREQFIKREQDKMVNSWFN